MLSSFQCGKQSVHCLHMNQCVDHFVLCRTVDSRRNNTLEAFWIAGRLWLAHRSVVRSWTSDDCTSFDEDTQAQFTQDAEHLSTGARKLCNTLWSMWVFTQVASNIKGFARKFECAYCQNRLWPFLFLNVASWTLHQSLSHLQVLWHNIDVREGKGRFFFSLIIFFAETKIDSERCENVEYHGNHKSLASMTKTCCKNLDKRNENENQIQFKRQKIWIFFTYVDLVQVVGLGVDPQVPVAAVVAIGNSDLLLRCCYVVTIITRAQVQVDPVQQLWRLENWRWRIETW